MSQAILAGAATVATLALLDAADLRDTANIVAPVSLADRVAEAPNLLGSGGIATDGDDDDEAQLQQQLINQQQTQEAEQQAEEAEQQANQQAMQDEQQGLLTEQQANLDVPGS
ncbi:hypothetical protein AWC20_03215 [Mycobacterium parmense]|nr:hypothetical protein AWC20_03215 [Mycobacterium parmense]